MTSSPNDQESPFDDVAHDYVGDLNRNLRLAGGDSRYFYDAKLNLIRSKLSERPRALLDFADDQATADVRHPVREANGIL